MQSAGRWFSVKAQGILIDLYLIRGVQSRRQCIGKLPHGWLLDEFMLLCVHLWRKLEIK